jgi:hypothetical protein
MMAFERIEREEAGEVLASGKMQPSRSAEFFSNVEVGAHAFNSLALMRTFEPEDVEPSRLS